MTATAFLPVARVHRRPDARPLDEAKVQALVESIGASADKQPINPIRVRPLGDDWQVTAGGHRLEAMTRLGEQEVFCIVVAEDDLHAELAMIDENLIRSELSPSEVAVQTARRKAIYLKLYPETAAHVAGAHASNSAQGNASANFAPAFAEATAKATGQSERTVQLRAERGEKVYEGAIELIREYPALDTGVFLDRLKKLTPSEQMVVVKREIAWLEKEKRDRARTGIARRVAPAEPREKPEPTYQQMREAVLLLCDLKPEDFTRLCPPAKRAGMFQKLAHLEGVFAQVREAVAE